MKVVLVASILICSLGATNGDDDLSSEYTNYAALDEDTNVFFYWSINTTDSSIQFAVQAKTTGWVGFGISTGQGKMQGADIVIGWVKEGETFYADRHATGRSLPLKDESQDFELTGSEEKDGKTTLKFKRKLETCDPQDNDIKEGTTKVIFAYGAADPESAEAIPQHAQSNRGARSLMLLNTRKPPTLPSNMSYYDIRNNETNVPQQTTTYWCKPFEIPQPPSKHHVVMIEPIIQKGNEGLVHHILVYECGKDFPRNNLTREGSCLEENMPPAIQSCAGKSTVAAWAIGGGNFYYPEHVGYPHGDNMGPRFVVMETHYDNPDNKSGIVDSSGLRFWFTDKLREYDAGIMQVGVKVNPWAILIPPKQQSWETTGYCPAICTEEGIKTSKLPGGGINIFSVGLHTHLAGRAISFHHVRKGAELPIIAKDDNYDFNFQEYRATREISVLPGDELITTCRYNTMDRNKEVVGGLDTTDEMCLAFVMYYPRQDFTLCLSGDYDGYGQFGQYVALFKPKRWDETLANVLKKSYEGSKRVNVKCLGHNEVPLPGLKKKDVAKPVIWKDYKPKGVCEEPTVAQATAILPVAWLLLLAALVLGNPA